jgi:hypothetical protein
MMVPGLFAQSGVAAIGPMAEPQQRRNASLPFFAEKTTIWNFCKRYSTTLFPHHL